MIVITLSQLKEKIEFSAAVEVVRRSFAAYSAGTVTMPPPMAFPFSDQEGEICVKTAIASELDTYTIKQVSVIKDNLKRGIPSLNATMNVYSRQTGALLAVIDEQGWLTNTRTACAGAVADELFRQKKATVLGVIGGGAQAEFQLRVILAVNNGYRRVGIWNRTPQKVETLIEKLSKEFPEVMFESKNTPMQIVMESDTVLTATSATSPILRSLPAKKGLTLIAIGSDMPDKCEIAPLIYREADRIFVDSRSSNLLLGDIERSIEEGAITASNVTGELGEVLERKIEGRLDDDQVVIAKLVGIGAQDTYIGDYVYNLFAAS